MAKTLQPPTTDTETDTVAETEAPAPPEGTPAHAPAPKKAKPKAEAAAPAKPKPEAAVPAAPKPLSYAPEGKLPPTQTEARNPLRHDPTPDFRLLHHFKGWYVVRTAEGPELLPRLVRFNAEPGVAGVDERGSMARALADKTERGWTVVPVHCEGTGPDGRPQDYRRIYESVKGTVFAERWQRPYQVGTESRWDLDEAQYHDFLRYIRDAGIVPPPDQATLAAIKDIHLVQITNREEKAAAGSPRAKKRVEQLRADVDVIDKAIGGGE